MVKQKLNIDLLKRLRTRFLRMRHRKHFRMKQIAIKTDCGAAMCMIGHILDLEGYKMRLKRNYDPAEDWELDDPNDPTRTDYEFIRPRSKSRVVECPATEAAKRLGMDVEDASDKLFLKYRLRTPQQAAAHIQKMIDAAQKGMGVNVN